MSIAQNPDEGHNPAQQSETLDSPKDLTANPDKIILPSQPYTSPQQEAYFSNVLNKYTSGSSIAKPALDLKQSTLFDQIIEGRYDIHKRQWSLTHSRGPSSQGLSKSVSASIAAKRQLEDQLQNIESRLHQGVSQRESRLIPEQQRISFVRRMDQQRKELAEKKKQAARVEEERRKQEQLKAAEQLQRLNEERKAKRKQELLQKMKVLEDQRKARAQQQASQELSLRQKLAEQTMAEKMQFQYMRSQNEQLEEKKKRLAEIRNLHKPLDRSELDAHANKYEQFQKERAEASKQKKHPETAAIFYKSAFYRKVEKEQKVNLEARHEQELHRLKEVKDKLKRYAQHVRSDFRPAVDEKKAEELRFRSENMKRRSMSVNNAENSRKIGLRYLEFSKIKVDHHKLLGEPKQQTEQEQKKKVDYLAELREKNKTAGYHNAQSLLEVLERKGLPKEEKAKKIIEFASRLELKAKRKEEISRMEGSVSEELDSLYLQAIEAKLSLLYDS